MALISLKKNLNYHFRYLLMENMMNKKIRHAFFIRNLKCFIFTYQSNWSNHFTEYKNIMLNNNNHIIIYQYCIKIEKSNYFLAFH